MKKQFSRIKYAFVALNTILLVGGGVRSQSMK